MLKNKKQTPQLSENAVSGSRFVPMLFSTPMIIALLNGSKTETRRIIKVHKSETFKGFDKNNNAVFGLPFAENLYFKPKVNVSDIIWVRETFQETINPNEFCYKADNDNPIYLDKSWKWKPSLFMPKEACRLFLEVLSVSVKRLQDIDEQSAINEGVELAPFSSEYYKDYNGAGYYQKAVNSYYSLWNKINGKDSHKENPFVWVYKFRIVDTPDAFR